MDDAQKTQKYWPSRHLKLTCVNTIYAESDDGEIWRIRIQDNSLDLGCSLLTSPSIKRYFLENNVEHVNMDHYELLEQSKK